MEIRTIGARDGQRFKAATLQSLQDSSYAFGGPESYAEEAARPDDYWESCAAELGGEVPEWRDRTVGYFAFEGETLCGKAICYFGKRDPACAIFSGVWVAPTHRRHGVGRKLMEHAIAWARTHGATRLKLWVDDTNPEGVAFYRALGFEADGGSRPVSPGAQAMERSFIRVATV